MPTPSMSVPPITLRPVSPPGQYALVLGVDVDATQLEIRDLLPDADVDLALDVDEPFVLGDQRRRGGRIAPGR